MKLALVLIDLQHDFLETSDLQPPADQLVNACARLLACARQEGHPVIHVWTSVNRADDHRLPYWREAGRWMCETGTRGHKTPSIVQPKDGEHVIQKSGFNAFQDGSLQTLLRDHDIQSVVLCGLHLHACVRTFATECLERNIQVAVAEDAVASNDPIHAAAMRRWLANRCVRFGAGEQLLSAAQKENPTKVIHRSPRLSSEILFEPPIVGQEAVNESGKKAKLAGLEWRARSLVERCEILIRVADLVESAAEELAHQMATEIGKPISHGREEIRRTATNIRDVVHRAGSLPSAESSDKAFVRLIPLGGVAIITPWNNPVAIPLGKIVPALAYGNSVAWKPAPAGNGLAREISVLLTRAGVPAELVQLIAGDHNTAQTLAECADVDAVTLTGSLAAGRTVQEICARRFIPLQAELSGNNAAVVWEDADLDHAAREIAWGAFGFAGQRCTANRRVVVAGRIYDAFVEKIERAASLLNWGDPLDEKNDIGPVIHEAKRCDHERQIAAAETDPRVKRVMRLFGQHLDSSWVRSGAYAQPAIICCDQPDHVLVQEETMSPMMIVQRAQNFDEAIKLCNGVRHGLIASLFSSSKDLCDRFLNEAEAGIVKFNSSTAGVDVRLPFGGCKASSVGPPEHGEGDLLFYTRLQAVYGHAQE